jgi:ABC-type multidrug transport system ATPase subunit
MIIYPFTYTINDKKKLVNQNHIDLSHFHITGLCGPIGSGKSTFIKLLVDYQYRNLNFFSTYEFSAYLSQDLTRLFTGNTVRSVTDMYRDTRFEVGKHFREDTFRHAIKLLGFPFESRQDEYLTDFSEGEKQRLAIALTTATTAETAVYDEPTTALNTYYRHVFYTLIREQAKHSRIFIISHRINDILAVCDSLIWFENVEVLMYGPLGNMIREKRIKQYFPQLKIQDD